MAVMERARVVGGVLEVMAGAAGEVMVACCTGYIIACITATYLVPTVVMDRAVARTERSITAVVVRMAVEPMLFLSTIAPLLILLHRLTTIPRKRSLLMTMVVLR